jgi:hypothetical protein
MREGEAHPLWRALAAEPADASSVTAEAVEVASGPDREHFWSSLKHRYVQTNDPSRGVGWMWPAAIAATVDPGRELELFDIGASAGLNLVADRLPWVWTTARGEPVTPDAVPAVASRRGFDLRPPDLLDPEDARWLEALIWPGQEERLVRFRAGVAAFRELAAEAGRPLVEQASADDVARNLEPARAGGPRAIVYQSIMHDYLPADVRERYETALRDWLGASDPASALWIEFELAEGGTDGETAIAITVHVADGGELESVQLARCGPHPRVLTVDDAAVEQYRWLIAQGAH